MKLTLLGKVFEWNLWQMSKGLFWAAMAVAVVGCGGNQQSALKQIASNANEELINSLENGDRITLDELIRDSEKYGIDQNEIDLLKKNLAGIETDKMVLSYLDPNHKKGVEKPRWVWIPDQEDDESMSKIEAISEDERIDVIDGSKDPDLIPYPIITIGRDESLGLSSEMPLSYLQSSANSEGSLMLDTIRLNDDHEPWIKGAAEIYMVVSFIGKDGTGKSQVYELPAVDYDKRTYSPRKILHQWPENKYQIVNIAIFEHDSGHDYSTLVKAFVSAASGITTALIDPTLTTAVAVTGIVAGLADKVIDALPKSAFTDDDDFVDNINTIEKYGPQLYNGVGGNAEVRVSLYQLKANDE